MEHFVWDSFFETGLAGIDLQHRGLVDLINRFGRLLLQPRGVDAGEVARVLGELADYSLLHFTEEEQLMARSGLDARHVQPHAAEHAAFLAEVRHRVANHHFPSAAVSMELHEFLVSWLAFHILGMDQRMARQIAAVGAGASAEKAFSALDRAEDPATATLVRAMERLFRQISDRNRELFELNQSLEARVAQRTRELSEANLRLEGLALTDTLTGVANRRAAMHRLNAEWEAGQPGDRPLACIMIDLDDFKKINDGYGHDAGDEVLKCVARALGEALRTDDTLCRLGGDEFLVICSRTPLSGALQLAEELRREANALRLPSILLDWRGSVSVGVAVRSADMASPDDLLKAADLGLYAAKRGGRNRVANAAGASGSGLAAGG